MASPDPDTVTREPPRTARGLRTRAALVAAARTVFERDGYLNARLTDITTEAKCSTGSFYTYFMNKEEVFAAVLEEAQEEMLHPHVRSMTDAPADDPVAIIEAANRAYLTSYRRNAKLMRLLDQVAGIDDRFRELRYARSKAFAARNAESIRDLQARGLADPSLDPELTAMALSAMVGRVAFTVYVYGDEQPFEHLVQTLTRLWANALRLEVPGGPAA